jgi:hypothetical protein
MQKKSYRSLAFEGVIQAEIGKVTYEVRELVER